MIGEANGNNNNNNNNNNKGTKIFQRDNYYYSFSQFFTHFSRFDCKHGINKMIKR